MAHPSRDSLYLNTWWGRCGALGECEVGLVSCVAPPQARSIGLDLENTASDHMLIPAVIELSRAPLPEHWTFLSKAAQASFPRVEAKSGPTEDSPSSTKYYRNIMTGMETSVHPSAPCMQRIVMGIRRRMNGKKRILSSWVQFSGGSKCFFYNFRTGRRQVYTLVPCYNATHECLTSGVWFLFRMIIPTLNSSPTSGRLVSCNLPRSW